jgi:hypothetical protein
VRRLPTATAVVVVVVLSIVAVLLVTSPRNTGDGAAGSATGPRHAHLDPGAAGVELGEPAAPQHPILTEPYAEAPPAAIIEVRDAVSAQPLADAALYAVPPDPHRDVPSSSVLGTTGTDGRFAVEAAAEGSHPRTLGAWHPGYLPASFDAPRPGETRVVPLRRSEALSFRCVDRKGHPVPGVHLIVSRHTYEWHHAAHAASSGDPTSASLPGSDAATAAYRAWTDASGNASLSGMPRGDYQVRVVHKEYIALSHAMPLSVQIPSAPIEITMVTVHACVTRPSHQDRRIHARVSIPRYKGPEWQEVNRWSDVICDELRVRFPDCAVATTVLPEESETDPWVDVVYHAASGTRHEYAAPLLPLGRLHAPYEPPETRTTLCGLGEVLVRVLCPDGSEIPFDRMKITGKTEGGISLGRSVVGGERLALPPGSYRLQVLQGPWALSLTGSEVIQVSNGGSHELTVKSAVDLRRYRFLASGDIPPKCSVGLLLREENASEPSSLYLRLDGGIPSMDEIWLPRSSRWCLEARWGTEVASLTFVADWDRETASVGTIDVRF